VLASEKAKLVEYVGEFGEEAGVEHFMRWKCLTDLYYLGSEVLGWGEARRGKGRNNRLLDSKFHRWMCRELDREDDVLVIVARGSLKSAWIKLKIVQEILRDPMVRVGFYSITQKFVESQLRTIKRWLQTPLLMRLFPDVIGNPDEWAPNTLNQLSMVRPKDGPQESQVEVFGVGNTVTGRHFDRHVFDDLVDKDTVRTVELIEKTREWFSGVQPVLEPGGRNLMIGTPYHYSDLYHTVQEEEIFDRVVVRPIKENGKFIYRWWTEAKFKKATRGMTSYDIQSQYFCNPMPVEDMAFPPPQPTYDVLPEGEYSWYIAVDPAATTRSYSDETAIVIAAVTKDGRVYIEQAFHGKWPGNETAKRVIELAVRYEPRKVGIEYGLQEHLKYIIDNEKSKYEEVTGRRVPLYVEPIRIKAQQSKFDRVNWTLGAFVREGQVKIHRGCADLIAQMDRFTKNYTGRDDIVDAASMIFQLVEIFSFKNYTKEEVEWKPKDYFMFDEMFRKVKNEAWERRFVK